MNGRSASRGSRRRWLGAGIALAVLVGLLFGSVADMAQAEEPRVGVGPWRDAMEGPAGPLLRSGDEGPILPDQPRLLTLREAAQANLIEAVGFEPRSYRQVKLRIENKTDEDLRIDLCGSHLVPRKRGSCQRLGLGPIVTPRGKRKGKTKRHPRPPEQPPGTVIIGLQAGKTKVVHLHTCCLDAGTPAPSGHTFRVALDPLPAVRETTLRWWADNPTAQQGFVNRAIWQFRPINPDDHNPFEGNESRRPPRGGSAVAAHAGTVYMLRSGELLARDPDGIERFLGTEMDGVYPTDSAIYAISWGLVPGASLTAPAPRELWRLVPTGRDPWAHVATLPPTLKIHDIKVAPTGMIFAITEKGLYRVDTRLKRLHVVLETEDTDNLSIAFPKRGPALVTQRRPGGAGYMQGGERKGESMPVCELWGVDTKTGEKERIREFWNIRQIRGGKAGVYALSPGGKLRRMAGRSFRTAPGQTEFDRIVAVGRTYVWLESKRGRLVAVDKVGRIRFEAGPTMPDPGDFDLDTHNDTVVWRKRADYWRIEPSHGKRTKLENPSDSR